MTRKLVMIHFHFEYTEAIEAMLDRHGVADYVRYPMMEGKDTDGKHYGTQTFPGNVTVVHAQVDAAKVDKLMEALVLPIERKL